MKRLFKINSLSPNEPRKYSASRFFSVIGLIGAAASASAADYAPPVSASGYSQNAREFDRLAYDPMPMRSMISAYVGVSGGWISYRSDASATLGGNWITRLDMGAVNTYANRNFFGDGMTYGLSAGIRGIVNGFDLRADVDTFRFSGYNKYSSGFITSSAGPSSFYGTTIDAKIENITLLRFGFGMNGAYVAGGPAFASRSFSEYIGLSNPANGNGLPATASCSVGQYCTLVGGKKSSISLGWVISAGYEFAIAGNLFGMVDYSYINFPEMSQEFDYNYTFSYPTSFKNKHTGSILRFGLRYYLAN